MLAGYKSAFPECPERIVAMAERQSQHRQDMERTDLNGAIALRKRGQIIGALLATIALLGGIYRSPTIKVSLATASCSVT